MCFVYRFWCSAVGRSFVRIWTTGALYTYWRRLDVLMHVFYLFLVRFICLTAQQQISYFNRNYRHFVGCIGLDFDFVVWMCVRASAASNQNLNTYTHFCHSTVSFNCLVQRLWVVSVCLQKFPWLRDHATMKRTKQGLILSMNKNKANFTNDSLTGTFARTQAGSSVRSQEEPKFIVCHVCRRRYVGHTDPSALPSPVPNQLPFTFVRMHNVFVRFSRIVIRRSC